MKKKKMPLDNVICDCGYQNHKSNVDKYGTCKFCGKVLNPKAKFDYEMFCKLRLWRKSK